MAQFDRKELGRRLRVAREACGLTQDRVAQELGLSRPTLTQLELGNRELTSIELHKLAYLYGRDMRNFFEGEFSEANVLAALFRTESSTLAESPVLDGVRRCIAMSREMANLELLLGIDRAGVAIPEYSLPAPARTWDAIEQGDRVAFEERRRVGLGVGPAPNLAKLLESQGVSTGEIELPEGVSGMTMMDARLGFVIAIRQDDVPVRKRFSIAHEIAHLLFDRAQLGVVSRGSERTKLIEVRANAFAASFLMPEEGVWRALEALGKGKPSRMSATAFDEEQPVNAEARSAPGSQDIQLYDLVQLAADFGVSRLTALYRLKNIRAITASEFDTLKDADAAQGAHLAEILGLNSEPDFGEGDSFVTRLLALAMEALRREEISKGKFVQIAALCSIDKRAASKIAAELERPDDGAKIEE